MRATNFSPLFLRFKDGYGMHAGFVPPCLHPLYAAIRLILAL